VRVLALYEYPPVPGGLATQGDLLYRGLRELGVEVTPVDWAANQEKEWYYRWYAPDVAVGVGYWGYAPDLVAHPRQFGVLPVPWLVADGYIARYRELLNDLPLILVTSAWVREVYIRDGIRPEILEVLPVGCDTDAFVPRPREDPRVQAVREGLGVKPDEVLILTIGGDAASKGAQEVMRALARLKGEVPPWKYVCKVWPQVRTTVQNVADEALAHELGIADRVIFTTGKLSRTFIPYLLSACDIYAGPSRLEGFGMPHIEAGACGRPVVAIRAMAFCDTLVHGTTALLAGVAEENWITETCLDEHAGACAGEHIVFPQPRIADYRASIDDLTAYLGALLCDPALRDRLGAAGRERAVACYHYRVVAKQFCELVQTRLAPHLAAV
jgi:starch synthase